MRKTAQKTWTMPYPGEGVAEIHPSGRIVITWRPRSEDLDGVQVDLPVGGPTWCRLRYGSDFAPVEVHLNSAVGITYQLDILRGQDGLDQSGLIGSLRHVLSMVEAERRHTCMVEHTYGKGIVDTLKEREESVLAHLLSTFSDEAAKEAPLPGAVEIRKQQEGVHAGRTAILRAGEWSLVWQSYRGGLSSGRTASTSVGGLPPVDPQERALLELVKTDAAGYVGFGNAEGFTGFIVYLGDVRRSRRRLVMMCDAFCRSENIPESVWVPFLDTIRIETELVAEEL